MARITQLGLGAYPVRAETFGDKTPANYPAIGLLVEEFDIWQQGYDGAIVRVYMAGTTELMPLYSDPGLTQPIANPQNLTTLIDTSGNRYGKFATNVYAPFAYQLDINGSQQTGVRYVPLYTLGGEDASEAFVQVEGGSVERDLRDILADTINVQNYGVIGSSPATNTTTINAAIAEAQNRGGGTVVFPAGTIPFNQINLPANVFLAGCGRGVTVLQSQVAATAITVTGNNAGLVMLTLDGVSVLPYSIGLFGRSRERVQLLDAEVKRFDVNIYWQGGRNHIYRNAFLNGGRINFRARGDLDITGNSQGSEFSDLDWIGGECKESTGTGIELYVLNKAVRRNCIRGVRIKDNVGTSGAIYLYGAQRSVFESCELSGNTYDLIVKDNPDTSIAEADRKISGLLLTGGGINAGTIRMDGNCEDVIFDDMFLEDVTFDLTTPTNSILMRDCTEDNVLISGESTKFLRFESRSNGTARVETSNATATTIWRARLEPNKIIAIEVMATAEQTNGTDFGVWHISHAARGAVATLAYDNQTANFTAGRQIQGQTSGATAIIVADSDSGTTGTLSLGDVKGVFFDNEIITETSGTGSAQANGILVEGSAAIIGTATVLHSAGSNTGAVPSGWDVTFAVSGQELLVKVTGASSKSIKWESKINTVYRS